MTCRTAWRGGMRKLTSEGCSLSFLPRSTDGVRNQSAGHDHREGVTLLMNRREPFRIFLNQICGHSNERDTTVCCRGYIRTIDNIQGK